MLTVNQYNTVQIFKRDMDDYRGNKHLMNEVCKSVFKYAFQYVNTGAIKQFKVGRYTLEDQQTFTMMCFSAHRCNDNPSKAFPKHGGQLIRAEFINTHKGCDVYKRHIVFMYFNNETGCMYFNIHYAS